MPENIGIEVDNSLSEKRYNDCGNGVLDAAGSRTGTAMVYDGRHARKEPFVRTVANVIDVFGGLTSEI